MVTEARETGSLIGSDKVEGTAVYGVNDTKIGSIERVVIDKMSGRVSYAVLSFGGFLGIGDDHYPLPWQSLKYDTNLGGYRTGITETQLKGAPNMARRTACVSIILMSLAIHTFNARKEKTMKHGDVGESRGTKFSSPHFLM